MTEFMGLDLEMAIEEHYHEVLDVLDGLFLSIFKGLQTKYQKEIEVIRKQHPSEEFVFLDKTLRLTFAEGMKLLQEAGATNSDGTPIGEMEDMSTENEKFLGRLVKQKYGTDYFILDKFPLSIRPFYTMPDPSNSELSNSYDFFMRGEEILSGAQRIHDPDFLVERMKVAGIEPASMEGYLNAFRLGAPPHGGGGIGELFVLFLVVLDTSFSSSHIPFPLLYFFVAFLLSHSQPYNEGDFVIVFDCPIPGYSSTSHKLTGCGK